MVAQPQILPMLISMPSLTSANLDGHASWCTTSSWKLVTKIPSSVLWCEKWHSTTQSHRFPGISCSLFSYFMHIYVNYCRSATELGIQVAYAKCFENLEVISSQQLACAMAIVPTTSNCLDGREIWTCHSFDRVGHLNSQIQWLTFLSRVVLSLRRTGLTTQKMNSWQKINVVQCTLIVTVQPCSQEGSTKG